MLAIPNDTYADPTGSGSWSSGAWLQPYANLWGLQKIDVERAWDLFTRDGRPGYEFAGEGVVVAVVDTGISYSHPDLADNIWINAGEIPGNGVDDDGNGFVDDQRGWDFWDSDNNPNDGYGHGTHVAGIIAAAGNNGQGVVGVAPKAKLMAVQGISDYGLGSVTALAEGVLYAVNNGADVINNSWGVTAYNDPLLTAVFSYAWASGCVSVAGAGNSNSDIMLFAPANISKVIAVAAITPDDRKTFFSNFGEPRILSHGIDVAAPGGRNREEPGQGENILSTMRDGSYLATSERRITPNYYLLNGTSMASPFVAGVAALLLSRNPNYSNFEVAGRISSGAVNIDDLNPEYRGKLGTGRINAYNSLAGNVQPVLRVVETAPAQILKAGAKVNISATLISKGIVARNVRAALTSSNSHVNITRGEVLFGDMNWSDQVKTNPPFALAISPGLPSEVTVLPFSLRITSDNGPEVIHDFELKVNAPVLLGVTVMDGVNPTYAPAVDDLNGDGKKEIVIILTGGIEAVAAGIAVFDSDNRIMPGWPVYPDPADPPVLSGLALGDMNQDGLKDIVVASAKSDGYGSGATSRIYAYDFRGQLLPNFPISIPPFDRYHVTLYPRLILADLDRDDHLDIFLTRNPSAMALDAQGNFLPG